MVEFQYFDGCPNSEATLRNVQELVREGLIPESELRITEVKSPEEAAGLNFQGSPTILVNGEDIYTGEVPGGVSYSCRTYLFGDARSGILSKHFIGTRYREFS